MMNLPPSDAPSSCGDASPPDFFSRLRHSGVLTRRQLEQVRDKVRAGRYPCEATHLARRLVRMGFLTDYQARRILKGKLNGLVVGRYIILDRIGAGSMGRVYKARHRLMGRIVALKIIAPEIAFRPKAVGRFRREMQLVGRLDHANIVRAYDADYLGQLPYLVMEYVPGQGLDRRLLANGPLPAAEVIEYAEQAAEALAHAHERGVVHRDIKPSNLILDEGGRLKILDFGLGAMTGLNADDPEGFRTADGCTVGTIDYMAPEQCSGREVDGRCDLYSLGCVMYRLLTGRVPFPGKKGLFGMSQRIGARPEPLSAMRPDLPAGVIEVVETLMENRPEDRYPDASAAAEALHALAEVVGVAAPVGRRASPTPVRAPSAASSMDDSFNGVRRGPGSSWVHRLVHMVGRHFGSRTLGHP